MEIKRIQGDLRLKLIGLYHQAKAGHIGCSLSCLDLMIGSLIQRKKPGDSFILSKGHAAAALYVCLNYMKAISDEELQTFYKNGTKLPAHPLAGKYPEISFALGSLGHGLPIACGISKAFKLKGNPGISYVLMSDGETNEGTLWEAAHYAVRHRLDNLVVMIDKNGLQGFGNLEDVLGDTASPEKMCALGFEVVSIDGHNPDQIEFGLNKLLNSDNGKPKLLIGNTFKGKGISFMENKLEWHYLPMSDAQYAEAVTEIKRTYYA